MRVLVTDRRLRQARKQLQLGQFEARTNRDYSEEMMRLMPAAMSDIAKQLGMPYNSIRAWLYELHRMGWVHIADWRRPEAQGPFTAIYGAGPGVDKPCQLKPISANERQKMKRAEIRKDAFAQDAYLSRMRVRRKLRKVINSGKAATPFDALF